MADITMCTGAGCAKRESCYRFTAIPNPFRQSFFVEVPIKNGECVEFSSNRREVQS